MNEICSDPNTADPIAWVLQLHPSPVACKRHGYSGWRPAASREHPCSGSRAQMIFAVVTAGWRDHRIRTRDRCGMRDLAVAQTLPTHRLGVAS